jgi:hypothetical protein
MRRRNQSMSYRTTIRGARIAGGRQTKMSVLGQSRPGRPDGGLCDVGYPPITTDFSSAAKFRDLPEHKQATLEMQGTANRGRLISSKLAPESPQRK